MGLLLGPTRVEFCIMIWFKIVMVQNESSQNAKLRAHNKQLLILHFKRVVWILSEDNCSLFSALNVLWNTLRAIQFTLKNLRILHKLGRIDTHGFWGREDLWHVIKGWLWRSTVLETGQIKLWRGEHMVSVCEGCSGTAGPLFTTVTSTVPVE